MSLSQSTQGEGFRPEPEYSGRGFSASARVLWERDLGVSILREGFGPEPEYSERKIGPEPEYSGRVIWA